MRFSIFLFLFIGLTHLYSQNIDLNQLTKLRETNYKIVDKELLKMGWKKTISKELINNYKSDLYFLNKGSNNEKVLTLIYSSDYELKNNTISYNTIKDKFHDDFISQIKSSGYILFKTNRNENVISDYYESDTITIVISVLKGIDSQMQNIDFVTIYLATNEDYKKNR